MALFKGPAGAALEFELTPFHSVVQPLDHWATTVSLRFRFQQELSELDTHCGQINAPHILMVKIPDANYKNIILYHLQFMCTSFC